MTDLERHLADLGMTQRELVRVLIAYGDTGTQVAIRRRVSRWMTGKSDLPGEMVAFLNMLREVRHVSHRLVSLQRRK